MGSYMQLIQPGRQLRTKANRFYFVVVQMRALQYIIISLFGILGRGMYARPYSPKQPQTEMYPHNVIIGELEERLNLTCSICSHHFDTAARKPKIICRRQHTYCQECISLIQKSRPFRCPECRFKVYDENIFVNRALLNICEYFPRLRKDVDEKICENTRLKQQNEQLRAELCRLKNKYSRDEEGTPPSQNPAKREPFPQRSVQQKQERKKEGAQYPRRRTTTVQKINNEGTIFQSPARKLKKYKGYHLNREANNPQLQMHFIRIGPA